MKFLQRFLDGSKRPDVSETHVADPADPADPAELDAAEREHELDILRGEQERLDELTQRQLRYADYAWQPPAQGGERRADDTDETANSG
jgi:hypothetical protein